MPLLRVAQSHSSFNQPPYCFYTFAKEHYRGWMNFWKEMDGDREKILSFAKKGEVDNPEEWFDSLHHFLFDVFSGDYKLLKKAAKKTFGEFLAQVAENHVNDPKDRNWYFLKGLLKSDFIRVMEYAAEMPDVKQAVGYVNARTPEFGAKLYSEWLLSKTQHFKEMQTIASTMNKKAAEIEKGATGKTILSRLVAEDKIRHAGFPNEVFEVVCVHSDFIVVEDRNNKEGYIFDTWNVEKA